MQDLVYGLPRILLPKLFGNSEQALLCGFTSRQNGAKGTLFAPLHYPQQVIEARPHIFQTVSEGEYFAVRQDIMDLGHMGGHMGGCA